MRQGKVLILEELHCLPNESNDNPVYMVTTDCESPENSFYMKKEDKDGNPITIEGWTHDQPVDENTIRFHDEIIYDKQDGFHKKVIWNNREFRQRGYSFNGRPGVIK